VPADLPPVVGVRDQLVQVFFNLVLNAIDATKDQGKVHVEAHVEDDRLILSVEDDGRGISLADRCRLFQPFFTTKPHGTGLGLFVSRQILEDVAGQLDYRSEPGQGSTFIICLPLEPSARGTGLVPMHTVGSDGTPTPRIRVGEESKSR
jgi:signal transduction histidine kinase